MLKNREELKAYREAAVVATAHRLRRLSFAQVQAA